MKQSLVLVSLFFGVLSFGGCGSSSDSVSSQESSQEIKSTTSSLAPVTRNVVCDPKQVTTSTGTYDLKYSADGEIGVVCKNPYGAYQLEKGITTLTIIEMTKVEEFNIHTTKTEVKVLDTYFYKTGKVHRQVDGEINGRVVNYDCIERYPSPLPSVVTDTITLGKLLDWDEGENSRVSTTCPASYYEDGQEDEDTGTATLIRNYTLIDSEDKKHLLTETVKITSK